MDTLTVIKDEYAGLVSEESQDYVLKNIKCSADRQEYNTEPYLDAEKQNHEKRKLITTNAVDGYDSNEMIDFGNLPTSKLEEKFEEELPDEDSDIPICWTRKQLESFQEKYIYLTTKKGKLGCSICAQVTNLGSETGKFYHVSKQWRNCDVKCNGHSKATKQASLRKKLSEHFASSSHLKALHIVQTREGEQRNGIHMSDFDADMQYHSINFVEVDVQPNLMENPYSTQPASRSLSSTTEEHKFRRKRPSNQQFFNYMKKKRADEDEYEAIGKIIAAKLRKFPKCQKLIAERLLHELLYQGQVSGLTSGSIIYTPAATQVTADSIDNKNNDDELS